MSTLSASNLKTLALWEIKLLFKRFSITSWLSNHCNRWWWMSAIYCVRLQIKLNTSRCIVILWQTWISKWEPKFRKVYARAELSQAKTVTDLRIFSKRAILDEMYWRINKPETANYLKFIRNLGWEKHKNKNYFQKIARLTYKIQESLIV